MELLQDHKTDRKHTLANELLLVDVVHHVETDVDVAWRRLVDDQVRIRIIKQLDISNKKKKETENNKDITSTRARALTVMLR